jgi:hypothetical protein
MQDIGAGSVYVIEPGHDAWVVGDEAVVGYEFDSRTAEDYASEELVGLGVERSGRARPLPHTRPLGTRPASLRKRLPDLSRAIGGIPAAVVPRTDGMP